MEVKPKDIEAHQYVLFSLSILQDKINHVLYAPVSMKEGADSSSSHQLLYWMGEMNGLIERINESADKIDCCIRNQCEYLGALNAMETSIEELIRLHAQIANCPHSDWDEKGVKMLHNMSEHVLYQIDSFIDRYATFVDSIEKPGRLGVAKQSALLVFHIAAPMKLKALLSWFKSQKRFKRFQSGSGICL